ncbi:MAG: PKD domain-containing protein [Candidatus Poseidoniaceae archaeon]
MFTHDVRIAFTPQSTVVELAISKDGNFLAWAEKMGLLNISVDGIKTKSFSIEGEIQGLFFRKKHLYAGDDNFGIRCFDENLEAIWECQINGGTSIIEQCDEFVAVVDNLGRLVIVDYLGKIVSNNLPFTSIINILRSDLGLIIVQEDGSVFCFDGRKIIWNRPPRGEVGESITCVGSNLSGELVIGREGYALVPGDEEALEIEVWDIKNNKLLMRNEIKNRLTKISPASNSSFLGFDNGSIRRLQTTDGIEFEISDVIFDCKFPVKTLNVTDGGIIAGSWFYVHGIMNDGTNWMVEHQGIVQYSAYSKFRDVFYFAGDDQNDYTNIEPIGVIDLSTELIEKDKSELTEWFDSPNAIESVNAEDIYSEDDKFEQLLSNSNSGNDLQDGNLSNLLSALEDDIESMPNNDTVDISDRDVILEDLHEEITVSSMPVASAGEDRIYDAGLDESSIIILDSSETKGDKNRIVSYSWVDETGKEISDLPKLRVKLNKGRYRFELRITDDEGNSTSDTVQVDVI